MGNQLFQYSCGRALAIKYKTDLKLDLSYLKNIKKNKYTYRTFYLDHFKMTYEIASYKDTANYLRVQLPGNYVKVYTTTFNQILNLRPSKSWYKEKGVKKETARLALPLSMYTKYYWKIDLRNLMNFFIQRLASDTQWETQQYASAIFKLTKSLFPATIKYFKQTFLKGPKYSENIKWEKW